MDGHLMLKISALSGHHGLLKRPIYAEGTADLVLKHDGRLLLDLGLHDVHIHMGMEQALALT